MGLLLYWEKKGTREVELVRFDVITAETHEALMAITSHPVEEGADVVDHARPESDRVTIEGYVSNKPLFQNPGVEKLMSYQTMPLDLPKLPSSFSPTPGGLTRTLTGFVDKLLNPPANKALVLRATGPMPNRARDLLAILTKAQADRALVTVVSTGVQLLNNMLLERVAVPRTPEDGDGLKVQLDLKRVRIVKSETVDAPKPAEARGKPQENKGSKAAQAGDTKKAEKAKSIAKSMFDSGKGLLGGLGF